MLSHKQLKKLFKVPVIDEIVEIDPNKLYGFSSCSNIVPEWSYTIGGFLMLYGIQSGQISYWENIDDSEDEDEGYYNSVFFELHEGENGLEPSAIIMKVTMNKKMQLLRQGFDQKHKCILQDMSVVEKNTYEKFKWDI